MADIDDTLIDAPRASDDDQQHAFGGQRHEFRVPNRSALRHRVLHDGDLMGQLGEETNGAGDEIIDAEAALEEGTDGATLRRGQRLDRRKLVHEQAITLVRRDAPRARVWLGDVALILEHGHVVADRRRGDAQVVAFDERLAPDGLTGIDIVGHDGLQDFELSFVEHVTSLALESIECQITLPRQSRRNAYAWPHADFLDSCRRPRLVHDRRS